MRSSSRARRRRWWWLAASSGLFGLFVAAALSQIAPLPAAAHAQLQATSPASGDTVAASPSEIALTFNEPVTVGPDGIRVLDADGVAVATGEAHSEGARASAPVVGVLGQGSYVVSWQVVSADSHPLSGGFTFNVGSPSGARLDAAAVAASLQAPVGVQILEAAVSFALYLGVLLAAGSAVFLVFVDDEMLGRGTERRRALRPVRFGCLLAIGAAVMSVPVGAADVAAGMPGLSAIRSTAQGPVGLQALVVAAAAAVLLGALVRHRPGRIGTGVAAMVGAAAALAGLVLVGHSRTASPSVVVLVADLLHVAVAAAWFGGLVLLTIDLRWRRQDGREAVGAAAVVSRFSAVATIAIVAVAVAGMVLGWRIVGSFAALVGTTYGAVLLAKISLFAVVAGLGAYNHFRLVPAVHRADGPTEAARGDAEGTTVAPAPDGGSRGWETLTRMVRLEVAVLVVVVGVTAVLVSLSPNLDESTPVERGAQAASPTTTPSAPAGPFVTSTALDPGHRVEFRIDPAASGSNHISLRVVDDTGAPFEPVEPPSVAATMPSQRIGPLRVETIRTGEGTFVADVALPVPGTWVVEADVTTTKFDVPRATVYVPVRG